MHQNFTTEILHLQCNNLIASRIRNESHDDQGSELSKLLRYSICSAQEMDIMVHVAQTMVQGHV